MKRQRYFRVIKNKNYTVIDNRFLFDKKLSLESKGLFTIILSRPDNFNPVLSELAKHSSNGLHSHRKAYNGLVELGYVERISYRTDDGQFVTDYAIFENPELNPKFNPSDDPKERTDDNLKIPFHSAAFDLPTRFSRHGSSDAVNRTQISTTLNTNLSTKEKRDDLDLEESEFKRRRQLYSQISEILSKEFTEYHKRAYNQIIDDRWIYQLVDVIGEDMEQLNSAINAWKIKMRDPPNQWWAKSQLTGFYLCKLWNELNIGAEIKKENQGDYVPQI